MGKQDKRKKMPDEPSFCGQAISLYQSPLGSILIAADRQGLTGLWFEGQMYFPDGISVRCDSGSFSEGDSEKELPVLREAREWLDIYFAGREPDFMPPLHVSGTEFQLTVWEFLREIPYGTTVSYKEIAEKVAAKRGLARMSAQAVGGAVGRNKHSILIPCHRVLGSDGSLTGYAGGIEKKERLLALERER